MGLTFFNAERLRQEAIQKSLEQPEQQQEISTSPVFDGVEVEPETVVEVAKPKKKKKVK